MRKCLEDPITPLSFWVAPSQSPKSLWGVFEQLVGTFVMSNGNSVMDHVFQQIPSTGVRFTAARSVAKGNQQILTRCFMADMRGVAGYTV
jgi:hypothetical protein